MSEREEIEKSLNDWRNRLQKFMEPHIPEMGKCKKCTINTSTVQDCYNTK